MNPLKNNSMIIFIITCLLFKRAVCNIAEKSAGKAEEKSEGGFLGPSALEESEGNDDKEKFCYAEFSVVTVNRIKVFLNGRTPLTMNFHLDSTEAVAYDPTKKDLYITDKNKKSSNIYRIKTDGKATYGYIEHIVADENKTVQGIAFNHLTSTLYWATNDGSFYNVLMQDNMTTLLNGQAIFEFGEQRPASLAIDVNKKHLYWVNVKEGKMNASIERSLLDGNEQKPLLHELIDPRSLTMNEKGNRLYWISYQKRKRSIDYMELKESDTWYTLYETKIKPKPDVIAVYEQNVYWIDWAAEELWMVSEDSSKDIKTQVASKIEFVDIPIGLVMLSGTNIPKPKSKKSSLCGLRLLINFGIKSYQSKILKAT